MELGYTGELPQLPAVTAKGYHFLPIIEWDLETGKQYYNATMISGDKKKILRRMRADNKGDFYVAVVTLYMKEQEKFKLDEYID